MTARQIVAAEQAARTFLESIHRVVPNYFGVDVTDFQLGNFAGTGLVAYVLTNHDTYCSKWLVQLDGQICPNHMHPVKMEDIACEAGRIQVRLWGTSRADIQDYWARSLTVHVLINGQPQDIECDPDNGFDLILEAGDRVTLFSGTWHEFWPVEGMSLAVEVSTFNNDKGDNIFADERITRFVDATEIEQDDPDFLVTVGDDGFVQLTPR